MNRSTKTTVKKLFLIPLGVIQEGRPFKKPIFSPLAPHITLCHFPWLPLPRSRY